MFTVRHEPGLQSCPLQTPAESLAQDAVGKTSTAQAHLPNRAAPGPACEAAHQPVGKTEVKTGCGAVHLRL